ncbi:hypothetical protein [Natrinema sp. 74]|uniref:hypothetical protein n=1 Tax=Natrinema sp. 74 TaxID=3384159 RepID=UPI0038D468D4
MAYQGLARNASFLLLLVPVVALGLDHVAAIAALPLSLGLTGSVSPEDDVLVAYVSSQFRRLTGPRA